MTTPIINIKSTCDEFITNNLTAELLIKSLSKISQ